MPLEKNATIIKQRAGHFYEPTSTSCSWVVKIGESLLSVTPKTGENRGD